MWCNHNWEYDKSYMNESTTEIQFVCRKCCKRKLVKIEKQLLCVDIVENKVQIKDIIEKENNMLDIVLTFVLKNGEVLKLKNENNSLNAKLYTKDDIYMGEINWDINKITDMLFCE